MKRSLSLHTGNGGFTLVEIMITVAIVGLLATIAMPAAAKSRDRARSKLCVRYQAQVDGAVDQFALEIGLSSGAPAPMVSPGLLDYMKGGRIPQCPVGPTPFVGQTVGFATTCPNPAVAAVHVP